MHGSRSATVMSACAPAPPLAGKLLTSLQAGPLRWTCRPLLRIDSDQGVIMRLAASLSAVLLLCATQALGQNFPSKPMRIIVPFPPGGSTDIVGRRIAEKFQASMGQPVLVENKPGAGGAV